MKRILAVLLAVTLVMSASVTAFGANIKDVEAVQKSAAEYIAKQYEESGFTVNGSRYFEHVINAGVDVSGYVDGYFENALSALEGAQSSMDNAVQIISVCNALGEYPEGFDKEDAVALLSESNPVIYSPYNYVPAIRLCISFGLTQKAADYAEALAATYVEDKGPNFWGSEDWISGDDVATFILALAPVADKYETLIDNALEVLETYYSEDGYINTYTGANTDTTALALAAYCAVDNKDKADEIYETLIKNFYDSEAGCFKADYDEVYATADALTGIEEYLSYADYYFGWQYLDGSWYYFDDNGDAVKGWLYDGGKWYYLSNSNGAMQASSWIKTNGTWYYVSKTGAMQTSSWIKTNGTRYYVNASGAYVK